MSFFDVLNTIICFIQSNLSSFCIGIIGSLIASALFLWYERCKDEKREKLKYGAAAGKYTGYGPTTPGGDTINLEAPISCAEITYLGGNMLEIILKEKRNKGDENEWKGQISMESRNYGIIVYKYTILHGKQAGNNKHRFGTKRFHFLPEEKKIVYLEETFGREIFIEH